MRDITVQFLSFEGCPLAPRALDHLLKAAHRLKGSIKVGIDRVDLLDPTTPDTLKRWGSPTILLNRRDISGAQPGDADSCRLYPGPGGVMSAEEIITAISRELEP